MKLHKTLCGQLKGGKIQLDQVICLLTHNLGNPCTRNVAIDAAQLMWDLTAGTIGCINVVTLIFNLALENKYFHINEPYNRSLRIYKRNNYVSTEYAIIF